MKPTHVQRYIDVFESLTPLTLQSLEDCFAEDARFVDLDSNGYLPSRLEDLLGFRVRRRMGDAEAGIRDYAGASLAKVVDENENYSRGALFLKTLLPEQRVFNDLLRCCESRTPLSLTSFQR